MATLPKPFITIDGNLSDWIASERIDYGDVPGYSLYAAGAGRLSPFRAQWPGDDRAQHHGLVQHRPERRHRLSDLRLRRRRRIQPQHQGRRHRRALYRRGRRDPCARQHPARLLGRSDLSIEFAIPVAALGNPSAIDIAVRRQRHHLCFPPTTTEQPYVATDDDVDAHRPTGSPSSTPTRSANLLLSPRRIPTCSWRRRTRPAWPASPTTSSTNRS